MKAQLKYCPDLRDCVLEDRLVPVIPNELGDFLLPVVPNVAPIVLTPAGYVLMSSVPRHRDPRVVRRDGLGGNLQHAAGQRQRQRGSRRDHRRRLGGQRRRRPDHRSGHAQHRRQRRPPCRALIGRVSGDRSDVLPPEQVYRGGLPVSASGGLSTEGSGQRSGPNPDERPVDPLPIRLRSRPHRLPSGASGSPVGAHADRAP